MKKRFACWQLANFPLRPPSTPRINKFALFNSQNGSRRLGGLAPVQPRGGRAREYLEHAQLYLADDGLHHGSGMRHIAEVSANHKFNQLQPFDSITCACLYECRRTLYRSCHSSHFSQTTTRGPTTHVKHVCRIKEQYRHVSRRGLDLIGFALVSGAVE